ncbi:hypothetical protein [Ancrocorticia populi]|uniref:hypothetical protein n=1 Tax=Ancrocorticia populi TaxID=2175228 RepID=UPI003F9BC002
MTTIHSIHDGAKYTVDQLMADPKAITTPILTFLEEWDLAKFLLRDGGSNLGSVVFEKDAVPMTEDALETVPEFSEVPTTRMVGGKQVTALSEVEARALSISYQMRDYNKVDQVKRGIQQLQNRAVYDSSQRLKTLVTSVDTGIESIPASAPWGGTGSAVVHDVYAAIEAVVDAEVPGFEGQDVSYTYEPTTMIMPRGAIGAFLQDEEVRSLYVGNIASENPVYKGVQSFQFAGLTVVCPKFWFKDRILITEPGALGFYSDAQSLIMRGPMDKPETREVRYQLERDRALGIDQPKAGVWITGIK